MRPSLSFTAESGRPTMVNFGKPEAASASTRTRWASTPRTAAVSDVASNAILPPRSGARADRGGREPRGGRIAENGDGTGPETRPKSRVGFEGAGTTTRPREKRKRLYPNRSLPLLALVLGRLGVDRERGAGGDQGAAEVVPAPELAHGDAVHRGDAGERVTGLDAIADAAPGVGGQRRRRRLGGGGRGSRGGLSRDAPAG